MNRELSKALEQIQIACEAYVGNKHQHVVLDQALSLIKEALLIQSKEKEDE